MSAPSTETINALIGKVDSLTQTVNTLKKQVNHLRKMHLFCVSDRMTHAMKLSLHTKAINELLIDHPDTWERYGRKLEIEK